MLLSSFGFIMILRRDTNNFVVVIISYNPIVVFVNIDNKDQYIYLSKNIFSTNFLKVVYYDQV